MEGKDPIGPKLLSLKTSKWKFAYVVVLFGLWHFKLWFSRLPFYLEWTLFLFVSLRFGHVIHRLILSCMEKDVLIGLWKKSKFCFLRYVFGDFVEEVALFVLTAIYYKTIYQGNSNSVFVVGCFCSVISVLSHFMNQSSDPVTKRAVAEQYNLNIGYGLAYFYYHNYLAGLIKENKFIERLARYTAEQEVSLSTYKLFILVPHNCVVEKYIDNNPNESMRAKEAPPLHLDVAGVRDRVYNNTVYELFPKGPDNSKDILRLVMECAQPVKQLRELYTREKITEEEMLCERESFIYNLKKFLLDDYDSFRTIHIVSCEGSNSIAKTVIKAATELQDKKMV